MGDMAGEGMTDRRNEQAGRRLSARDLLRWALVDDEDPRFPWWLPLPGLVLALLWAAYEGTMAGTLPAFLDALVWPGAALFLFGVVVTFFGWQLDID